MKVRIQSPLATMTAELTAEQALAIYGQVLEWLSETEENLDEDLSEEETTVVKSAATIDDEARWTPPPEPTPTIEVYGTGKKEALSIPLPESDTTSEKSHKRYKGFLYIRCEHCGKEKGFNARNPLAYHQCECGHRTELIDLKDVEVICGNCYKIFTYKTNINDDSFEIDCLSCQEPVTVELNTSKNKYLSTGCLR